MGLDMGLTMFLRRRKDAVSFLFTDTKQTRAKRATVNLAFVQILTVRTSHQCQPPPLHLLTSISEFKSMSKLTFTHPYASPYLVELHIPKGPRMRPQHFIRPRLRQCAGRMCFLAWILDPSCDPRETLWLDSETNLIGRGNFS